MPGLNGLETCKIIRDKVQCPILFPTARVQDKEIIEGLACGADDYLIKPFNIDVLGAKVTSHLRREERETASLSYKNFGDLKIYYDTYQVFVEENEIKFTKKEFEIISLLSKHQGQIFDRERIFERIWGYDAEGDSAIVTEYVKRIRNKLQKVTATSPIQTVWGVGYKWQ
jgi:DNA-binding response OmpR family regulator